MTVKTRLMPLAVAAQRLRMTEADLKKVSDLGYFSVFKGRRGPVLTPGDLYDLKTQVRNDPDLLHLSAPVEMQWIERSLVAWVEGDKLTLSTKSDSWSVEFRGECS